MPAVSLHPGDCLDVLRMLPTASVDAVVTDPPYPEIDREYGRWTEAEWHELMRGVVTECRRILKPRGSAMFVLQPNSEHVGRMRPWLWEFMAWTSREWNQVQDLWWWNINAPTTVHCHRNYGLSRPSIKACVWLGDSDCYRNQNNVLWSESQVSIEKRMSSRCSNNIEYRSSGLSYRNNRAYRVAEERKGVTSFNLLPIPSGGPRNPSFGHPAATPPDICNWWIRYISPPDGVVCDPFMGSGTTGIESVKLGMSFIGIERHLPYFNIARRRIAEAEAATPLFNGQLT